MKVECNFVDREDVKVDLTFMASNKGGVNLTLKSGEDVVSLSLNHADFAHLQDYMSKKKDEEREKRITLIMEGGDVVFKSSGHMPGTLDEKVFGYQEKV